MAAFLGEKLNRGMSMINGNGNGPSNGYDSPLTDMNTTRQLHNMNDTSPLQIFVKAKKKINDIFGDISDYVVETTTFIEGKIELSLKINTNSNMFIILL